MGGGYHIYIYVYIYIESERKTENISYAIYNMQYAVSDA